jgi:peptidyl-prolyl cis-trans isomerase B (cyclophilin B)
MLAPALAGLALMLLAGCSSPTAAPTETSSAADGACEYVADGQAAREATLPSTDPEGAETATVQTSAGDIAITLDAESAPCTVGSFASLAEQGYFDDTICHRLVTSGIFILQCGDPSGTGMGGPGYSYADELSGSETYPAGTVAMANAGADTNGSQFFLVFEDTELPPSYTVFGQMDAAGLAVVQSIAAVGSDANDAPLTEVRISSVSVS